MNQLWGSWNESHSLLVWLIVFYFLFWSIGIDIIEVNIIDFWLWSFLYFLYRKSWEKVTSPQVGLDKRKGFIKLYFWLVWHLKNTYSTITILGLIKRQYLPQKTVKNIITSLNLILNAVELERILLSSNSQLKNQVDWNHIHIFSGLYIIKKYKIRTQKWWLEAKI